ncbi:hypothetical protein ES319_D05G385000v1 [Gossypium barbadense]|uniref:Ig-like domain-containing protein n=1 Tax=Gossypium barbadense TaxID=3634 RepID=A0A5J5RQK7_GOSBA|nr:hypothetical protein ES319_D05G385000v1 [Gossypium barbadense]
MEYVEPGVGIANCLGPPLCKYLKYHRKLNDYVRNFGRIRDELNCKMADIERQLKAELLSPGGKIPKQGVENWLKDAKEMIAEAQDVEIKVRNGRYLCRAWNGKLVDEKTREMKEFLDKAPNASEALAMDGPSGGLPLPTSELVGEEAARKEIWACLMQEEVKKIGVWGMGGVGKTTIMKHIHNDLLKEQRFERVVWVAISKESSVMKVQDDIASALKLKEDLAIEGDKLRRAAILSEMLKKVGKHVLILDDVWDEVSLEEVGIPEPSDSNGCKLVLTTRSEHVYKYMDCTVIKVKPLSAQQALTLFLSKVGPNIVQNRTLMPIFEARCRRMCGSASYNCRTPYLEKRTQGIERDNRKVEGVEAKVIERLKFSFDHLKDEKVKYCFLHCALFPEDFEIWKDELIECWIEEGFIDDMATRHEMEGKGHVILKKLEDNCLLANITTEFGLHRIKMHDAVRDMALSITRMNPRYMIQAGSQLEELPEKEQWSPDIEKVSLMYNSISEVSIGVLPTKCQLLTTLLLRGNPVKKIPYSLFMNKPCLSVLNLSFTKIESLPNSISELKNLTTLLLRGCYQLRDLPYLPCLSMLQELKKLDLCGTKIEEVPEGMDMLIKLRYLDLPLLTLKETPAGLLPKLIHLQHLGFHENNEKTSLKAEEMEPLKKLECFTGRFEDINEFNKFISSMQQSKKNLIKYSLQVGSSFMRATRDKTVTIEGVQNWEGDLIMHPIEIQELIILKCDYLRSLVDDKSSFKNAIDLRVCWIWWCEGIECVVSLFSFASSSAHPFQSLEVLYLQYLPKLSALIMKDEEIGSATASTLAPSTTFSHLKEIKIDSCSSMKTLLPHWLLPNLQNLEEIHLEACRQLVEILGATTSEVEEKGSDALIKFHLPKLRELSFWELPNLKSICSKSGVMVCDSLQLIQVDGDCDKLKRIPPFVPLVGNGQPFAYAPPSLTIRSSTEWWESLEWDDHPNFKNVFLLKPLESF